MPESLFEIWYNYIGIYLAHTLTSTMQDTVLLQQKDCIKRKDKVFADLNFQCSAEEFIEEYKKQFFEEYTKYENSYNRILHEQKTGKGAPPSPEKYFKLSYNNAVLRHKKQLNDGD